MTRILNEDQIKKRLKDKNIDRKSYQKSFDKDYSMFEKPLEDEPNELLVKQSSTLEDILESLNRIEKNTGDKVADESFYRAIGKVMVEIENHLAFVKASVKKQKPKRWSFRIERNAEGLMKKVIAEED